MKGYGSGKWTLFRSVWISIPDKITMYQCNDLCIIWTVEGLCMSNMAMYQLMGFSVRQMAYVTGKWAYVSYGSE